VGQVKPIVGISGFPRVVDGTIGPTLLHTASRFYVESILRAGGVPVILPVTEPDVVPDLLAVVNGVVLTGGGDIAPVRYGATPVAETTGVDPARDDFDIALLLAAIDRDIPVLATCRGMQVVNVALGGSLVQDVPGVTGEVHRFNDRWREGVHRVKLEPDSHLAEALGTTEVDVNSLHHQAVLEAAPGTRPVGWAEDGTIEAIRIADAPSFALGVQWHAEYDPQKNPINRTLFEAFGAALADPQFLAEAERTDLPVRVVLGDDYRGTVLAAEARLQELWRRRPWRDQ
jgi:putative glutamine amidotransferase